MNDTVQLIAAEKVARASERFEQAAIRIGQMASQMEETAQRMEGIFVRFTDNFDGVLEKHEGTVLNNTAPPLSVDAFVVHKGQTVILSYESKHEDGRQVHVTAQALRDMLANLERQVEGRDVRFILLHNGLRIVKDIVKE